MRQIDEAGHYIVVKLTYHCSLMTDYIAPVLFFKWMTQTFIGTHLRKAHISWEIIVWNSSRQLFALLYHCVAVIDTLD